MINKIKYKIIDNFIDKNQFQKIVNTLFDNNFPWFFQNEINSNYEKNNNSFYFTHLLYIDNKVNSQFYDLFLPILNKIKIKTLMRVKINCYTSTEKIKENKPHTDENYKHKGCVFSFNTCDGYTKLKDGTKIKSIENRALFFDPSLPHQSTTCTNAKARFNMNVNYL